MTPDRWRIVTDLFHAALSRDAADRENLLAKACKDDASLRADVEKMLNAHREAGTFGNALAWSGRVDPLAVGTLLSAYRIEALIGTGGMGEVYRATDTRLGRTVAIKILPPHLRNSPDLQARFEREARTISQLVHPHICTIHDVGHENGIDFLVMEYLEGETLAARLARGAMPLEQVLRIGTEIASALDHAHRHGVIHRDVKPANVILTKSGAKLLDFGLVKLRHGAVASTTSSPTTQDSGTMAGTLLGTIPYMSPEQLEGREADVRSDIWAFGCVLYEMASGRRAFDSPSQAGLIAIILERGLDPLPRVQPPSPPAFERIVRTCLEKDANERWQSVSDLKRELEWIALDRQAVGEQTVKSAWRVPAMACVVVLAVLAGVWAARLATTADPSVIHAQFDVAPADEMYGGPANHLINMTVGGSHTALCWTPDGRAIVFAGFKAGVQQLYLRALDRAQAEPIAGTEGAYMPVVSSDGWVAFWSAGAIKKVSLAGGASTVLVPNLQVMPTGMSWNPEGLLYSDYGRIWHVPPGGQPTAVTTLRDGERAHILPSWLPDGKTFLYTARHRSRTWSNDQTFAQNLSSGQRRLLLNESVDARYAAGALVFMRMGAVFAAPFNAARVELRGEPVAVLSGVSQALRGINTGLTTGAGQFAVSPEGSLAYVPGRVMPFSQSRVVTVDRQGHVTPSSVPTGIYGQYLRLSPDGRAILTVSPELSEVSPLVIDRRRAAQTTLTRRDEFWWPMWTPDSKWILSVRRSDEGLDLVIQPADGSAAPERIGDGTFIPASASPDGRYILGLKNEDVWVLDRSGREPQLRPIVESSLEERWPVFSPDGRWFAYGRVESDRSQIYVQAFPDAGRRAQVSVDRGSNVAWNPNGRELFFVRVTNSAAALAGTEHFRLQMLAARVENGTPIDAPRVLFEFDQADLPNFSCFQLRCFDVTLDGNGFSLIQEPPLVPQAPTKEVNLVLNWMREVNARFRTSR